MEETTGHQQQVIINLWIIHISFQISTGTRERWLIAFQVTVVGFVDEWQH